MDIEDEGWEPEPIEDYCSSWDEWYTDYWCEYCGYHGHECSELIGEDE